MIRRLILAAVITSMLLTLGCGNMLNQQEAKNRDLGQVVEDNLKTSSSFWDYIESFTYTGTPGEYKCVVSNIPDGHTAGTFAYNCYAVLDERNNTLVRVGRSDFRIIGEQDGAQIFDLQVSAGSEPVITLHGPWEGEEFTPSFGR
jgi:hypothetical protein